MYSQANCAVLMVHGGDGKFITNISMNGETRKNIPTIYTNYIWLAEMTYEDTTACLGYWTIITNRNPYECSFKSFS